MWEILDGMYPLWVYWLEYQLEDEGRGGKIDEVFH